MLLIANSKLYDKLKFFAQIFLPALATLYFALAGIWGLPKAEAIVGSIVAIDTFLGVILQLSSAAYKNSDERFDGDIDVVDTPTKKTFSLNFPGDPDELSDKKEVLFKVNSPPKRSSRRKHSL